MSARQQGTIGYSSAKGARDAGIAWTLDRRGVLSHLNYRMGTLCYEIMLPGRKSAVRAELWPDCYREGTETGDPARKADFRPGSTIV